MKINVVQFTSLENLVEDWKFQMMFGGWESPIDSDPYQLWDSSQAILKRSSNSVGYASPVADKLIDEIRLEYDATKRADLNKQLHKVIHDDYPYLFLFAPKEINVYSDRFQTVETYDGHVEPSLWSVPAKLQRYTELAP